jgi:transposase
VIAPQPFEALDPQQLRQALLALMTEVAAKDELLARRDREVAFKQALIDKLTHENAILKRLRYALSSETFCAGVSAEQKSLLEETLDTDIAQLAAEIEQAEAAAEGAKDKKAKQTPKREPLPPQLPRRDVHHEPENTACACGCDMKRIGQDVAERLDYEPGTFTVERHVRGKWACGHCQKLVQAPVPAHVIDKGIPTAGLLAHVLVAKFLDHLPLYRQERIFERAGLLIARSTLAQWVGECGAQLQPLVDALSTELLRHGVLHADETPVGMLKPGNKKTHKAYVWTYCTTSFNETKAVVFNFAETRSGENVRAFLGQEATRAGLARW